MAEQGTKDTEAPAIPRWFDELRPGGDGEGFMERHLRHSLMFVKRPVNRLLVTFDNLSNVSDTSPDREPWAFKFAKDANISHLGVMAHVADWYRDADLIARFEKLRDEGFFDGYDRVTFAGVSMGGYASIAFASLVPGAHVVSINPQSTLNMDIVPWETRYEGGRRQDWTLPLSDAAALTGELGCVNIFYDPYHELDRQHVSRFSGDNIRIFNCRYSVHKTAVFLRKIDALKPVMHAAVFETIDEVEFYRLYRGRRDLRWFRGSVIAYFNDKGREEVAARFTQAFRKRLRAKTRREDRAAEQDAAAPAVERAEREVSESDAPQEAVTQTVAVKVVPSPEGLGPRRNDRCGIVTTMKNEGPFMLEWVAYHRSIGFTDFLIFTNDCDDGTDRIAMRLEDLGVAKHVDNQIKEGASPQRMALRRALKEDFYAECDWVMCADVDEFLNVRVGNRTLPDLFEATGPADAISVCWKIFGRGDRVAYEDAPVTEQFTWSAPEAYRDKYRALGLKSMFRPGRGVTRFGVHRPKFDDGRPADFIWKDAGGQLMPEAYYVTGWSAHGGFSHEFARLHHYSVRSVDSFLVKRDRGRTNHVDRDQGVAYWADMNLNMEKDLSLVPTVAQTRAEMDRLLQDPELARLHDAACTWHRAKIESLKSRLDWAAFHELLQQINQPGQDPKDCVDLLRGQAAE
ncbi:glycosyltransferase family 2 protein [Roseovarius aestuariivivens]|uniref:glycosyltransferase family 2 protein n=1 Tax=Roseovarius aestuariivivens TaxID=1888910 RepID=UPI001081A0EB|nr:glycosyltransferase family 2 protein [Roseovarius aestuariivivens]